jgi:hypothetical protein
MDLPPSLGHCCSLRELKISQNRLTVFPRVLGNLKELVLLEVRTPFTKIKKISKNCTHFFFLG